MNGRYHVIEPSGQRARVLDSYRRAEGTVTEIHLLVFLEIDPAVTSSQETNENSANGMVCRRHPRLLHQRGGAIDKLFNESYEVIRHIPQYWFRTEICSQITVDLTSRD